MAQKQFLNDQALLEGLKNNERGAFETLYEKHYGMVKGFIIQHGGDEAIAADIFQEGIIAFWNNIRRGKFELRSGTQIGSYLFQVCKFKWYEQTKSANHRKSEPIKAVEEAPGTDVEALAHIIHKEEIDRFVRLFGQLGEKCQQLLRFFYFDKMPMKQIAEIMGYAANSAKNEKYRCLMKLKAIFAKY